MKDILVRIVSQSKWILMVLAVYMVMSLVKMSETVGIDYDRLRLYSIMSLVMVGVTVVGFAWDRSIQHAFHTRR